MKRVKFLLFLLPALILLASPRLALADSKTFGVVKDTFANSVYNPPLDYRDNNYGGTGSVVVSNEPIDRFGYLWFENIEIPEGATLNQGTLKFYLHEQNYSGSAKLNIGPVSGDWEENTLTWNNKPTINQTQAVEAVISITEDGWKEVNITPIVQSWLEGAENKGIFIYPYGYLYGSPESDFAFSFKSKESGDLRAKLDVEYNLAPTPTPTLTPTPTPTPKATPTGEVAPEEEEPTPTPEEEPTPTPEPERGKILGLLSPGQALGGGLVLLGLVGLGIGSFLYLRSKKKTKEKAPTPPSEKKKETPKESS